jgi:hypothetical protein
MLQRSASAASQFLDFVHRRKLGPKCLLQVSLSVGGDFALCQIKPERSQRCNDHHDRGEQSGAKARDLFASRRTRRRSWQINVQRLTVLQVD